MRLLLILAVSGLATSTLISAEPNQAALRQLPVPPVLPSPQSPVDAFRRLLAMDADARTQELAKKSETGRKVIQERLKEFDARSSEQQRLRLRLMQLRWELSLVLHQAPTNRAGSLRLIPEDDRKLVTERLQHWDQLSPDLQKAVRENEMMLSYFISGQIRRTSELTNILERLPLAVRSNLLAQVKQWEELTPDRQKRIYENFREVFDLDAKERQKILRDASLEERQQIQRVMQSIQKLPLPEQKQCVDSFSKFTSMTMAERAEFLRNAERWKTIVEVDRQPWRKLIRAVPPLPPLPPPLRPGFRPNPGKQLFTNAPQQGQ